MTSVLLRTGVNTLRWVERIRDHRTLQSSVAARNFKTMSSIEKNFQQKLQTFNFSTTFITTKILLSRLFRKLSTKNCTRVNNLKIIAQYNK